MLYTKRLYYSDPFKVKHEAIITKVDQINNAVELDETIFHPQGGGQPSDQGTIGGMVIVKAINSPDGHSVIHLLTVSPPFKVGDTVVLDVDLKQRLFFTRLHSAGHLIHNIIESLFPDIKAVKGHHFPDEASIEFSFEQQPDLIMFQNELEAVLRSIIKSNAPVISDFNPETRIRNIKFADYEASPCGGTHVSSLDQIGELIIRGVKIVKDKSRNEQRLRVSYNVATMNSPLT